MFETYALRKISNNAKLSRYHTKLSEKKSPEATSTQRNASKSLPQSLSEDLNFSETDDALGAAGTMKKKSFSSNTSSSNTSFFNQCWANLSVFCLPAASNNASNDSPSEEEKLILKNYYTSIVRVESTKTINSDMFKTPKHLLLQIKNNIVYISYQLKKEPSRIITEKLSINQVTDIQGPFPLPGKSTEDPKIIARIVSLFNCPTYVNGSKITSQSQQRTRLKL